MQDAGLYIDTMICLSGTSKNPAKVGDLREFLRLLDAFGFDDYAELDEVIISITKSVSPNTVSKAADSSVRIAIV
jgi:hypothetical protein